MAHLLDQTAAVRLLQEHGWRVGGRSRHGIKMLPPRVRPIILPQNHGRPYGKGMGGAIAREAGLNPKEVRAWISRSKSNESARGIGRGL
jgi:hypothetical protein